MFPNESIIILSKDRTEKQSSYNLFKSYDKLFIVVEPQDFEKYKKYMQKERLIILPINNGGLSYVRNFILDNTIGKFIMLDDDINSLGLHQKTSKEFRYYKICNCIQSYINDVQSFPLM